MPSQIVNATIQAVVLSATSNILAQVLKSYRNDTPFSLNITPLIQFAIFTALNTPPNFLWQQFLEETFPGYTVKPAVVPASSTSTTSSEKTSPSSSENEKKSDDRKEIVPAKQLNIRNTAIKFLLDQTVGSLFNTVVFIAGIAALQGETGEVVLERVWNDSWSLMQAGYKLWPAVSLLNFTVVPFQYRMLFGGLVGVAWGIFLSLLAGGD